MLSTWNTSTMAVVPLSLGGRVGLWGHECALGEEGAQAIKRDALHAESTQHGTEMGVP